MRSSRHRLSEAWTDQADQAARSAAPEFREERFRGRLGTFAPFTSSTSPDQVAATGTMTIGLGASGTG
jgi:hypothetical protein